MPRPLLCALEPGEGSDLLRIAADLAGRLDLPLVALDASQPAAFGVAVDAPRAWFARHGIDSDELAHRILVELVAAAEPEARVDTGEAASRLLQAAADEDAELLVIDARSRAGLGATLLEAMAEATAADAPCPVVMVPGEVAHRRGGPIVCGVDGGRPSVAAVRLARALAERLDAWLCLVHAAAADPLPGVSAAPYGASRLQDHERRDAEALLAEIVVGEQLGKRVRCEVVFGEAPDVLRGVADTWGAEMIVVGSRGRGPFRSALFGTTSRALATASLCPVVAVPPEAAERAGTFGRD